MHRTRTWTGGELTNGLFARSKKRANKNEVEPISWFFVMLAAVKWFI
jgi:hypothetical protein